MEEWEVNLKAVAYRLAAIIYFCFGFNIAQSDVGGGASVAYLAENLSGTSPIALWKFRKFEYIGEWLKFEVLGLTTFKSIGVSEPNGGGASPRPPFT